MDEEQFDGAARAVADRGVEHAEVRDPFETLARLVAMKSPRRQVLVGLMAMVLQSQLPDSAQAGCRSKEGKNKRQCRRRQRKKHSPGGILDCPDLKSCYYLPGAPDAFPVKLGPLPGGAAGQCWNWSHFGCYPCHNTQQFYNNLCRAGYPGDCQNGGCAAGT